MADGGWVRVLAIERVVLDAPQVVYNFTVAGVHSYFVLEVGVLVHNCGGQLRRNLSESAAARKAKFLQWVETEEWPALDKLTVAEAREIQAIADEYNTVIDVVGSWAAGKGRNIHDPSVPVRQGDAYRSDIDFRFDITHPEAEQLMKALNEVSNGAGSAIKKHATLPAGRITYPPLIRFKPRGA